MLCLAGRSHEQPAMHSLRHKKPINDYFQRHTSTKLLRIARYPGHWAHIAILQGSTFQYPQVTLELCHGHLVLRKSHVTCDAAATHRYFDCAHAKSSGLYSLRGLSPSLMLLVVVPHGPPHCTVALEATAKSNLPNPVALPDTSCGLDVGQNIPASRCATT